nr:uncharacterized protein LOC109958450 [Monopterus albus]
MKSDLCDDTQSDSGVSTDFYPGSTLESNNIISTGTPTKETPIEREIRRAVERENSLRKSRGLPNPPTSPEYVEIPLKTAVLSQSFTAKSEGSQGKDRQFAGKMMYHEIHMETQREEDLVKLGKIPGLYDKGSVRQLKYKKQLFEAFQKPDDSTVSARSKSTSSYSANDTSALENREGISSQAPTVGDSHVENSQNTDVLNPKQNLSLVKRGGSTNLAPQGPGFSEATDCQVIILESNLSVPVQKLYAKQEAKPVTVVDSGNPNISSYRTGGHGGVTGSQPEQAEQDEEELTPKENPFFKLRSSVKKVKVEQDIRETQEREKELRKQRMSLYGCTGGAKGGGRPDSIEGKSLTLSSSSANGLAVLDSSDSSSTGGTGPSAARQSVGKLGVWPPAHAEEEKINQPQVHHCLQNSREKTPLVHQWESGLVNGHKEEDN